MAANAPLQRQRVAALGRGFSVGFVRADQHHRETPTVPEGTGTHHYSRIVFNYFRPVYNTRSRSDFMSFHLLLYRDISRVRETGSRARSPRCPQTHAQTMACMHIKP
jgi:hypothetical protein